MTQFLKEAAEFVVVGSYRWLKHSTIAAFTEVGDTALFAGRVFRSLLTAAPNPIEIVEQMYVVGVRSLPTTLISGAFVGAIMAIQINMQLRDFGAQGYLGGLSTSVTLRNVGPVLIAFILSGKVGAFTSAELGTMRVTDQIDALRCLGMDPIRFLIVPRLVAVILSSFMLLIVGLIVTVIGGIFISVTYLGVNPEYYARNIPSIVGWGSVAIGVFKSFWFGVVIAVLACHRGFATQGGAAGVGRGVRQAAVSTLVCIVAFDFLISGLMSLVLPLFAGDSL